MNVPTFSIFGKKNGNLYCWIDCIVTYVLPFFCERPLARKYSTLTPISTETLINGINQVMITLERKINLMLPNMFSFIF